MHAYGLMETGTSASAEEKINVLIVDDSLVIRGMVSSIIESDSRLRVVGAVASAEEADAVIGRQLVDVVTLDIDMPGMSGLDYLTSLARRRIPAVMLSSRISDKSKETEIALARGAITCFNKTEAVRGAAELLGSVREAARHRGKPLTPAAIEDDVALTPGAIAALDMLIAEHGEGLYTFIAQRVGFATLASDSSAIAKWVATARKLDELMRLRGKGRADRNRAWPDEDCAREIQASAS